MNYRKLDFVPHLIVLEMSSADRTPLLLPTTTTSSRTTTTSSTWRKESLQISLSISTCLTVCLLAALVSQENDLFFVTPTVGRTRRETAATGQMISCKVCQVRGCSDKGYEHETDLIHLWFHCCSLWSVWKANQTRLLWNASIVMRQLQLGQRQQVRPWAHVVVHSFSC